MIIVYRSSGYLLFEHEYRSASWLKILAYNNRLTGQNLGEEPSNIGIPRYILRVSIVAPDIILTFCVPKTGQLVFQSRNRHDKNSIRPLIGGVRHAAQYAEHGGRLALGIICDLFLYLQKICCRSVDLVSTQLDLESAPLPIRQFNYRVYLLALVVLIVV